MTQLDYQIPDSNAAAFRRRKFLSLLSHLGPMLGLITVCLVFSVLRPQRFARVEQFELIARQAAVVITVSLGMTLIIISGGIDISVGANVALCSVVVAVLLTHGAHPILAAGGGIATGGLVGLVIGLLVTKIRLSPFIVTLGFWGGLRGLTYSMSGLSANPLADVGRSVDTAPNWLQTLLDAPSNNRTWMIFPPGVWLALALAILVAAMLRYTRFGRHIIAIGSNEQAARLCGINVTRTKILIYVAASILTGIGGLLQYAANGQGDPTTAVGMELDVIAAVVIGGASLSGGVGSILGSVCGALLMKVIDVGCTALEINVSYQMMLTGGIIILAAAIDQLRHSGKGR